MPAAGLNLCKIVNISTLQPFNSQHINSNRFISLVKHPLKFRLYLLSNLPSAFFSGVRVKYIDEEICEVTVPFKWFSRNPFHSTYFACLSMAAEMSTGILAMASIYGRKPPVSMLVLKVNGDYKKKATGKTTFRCEQGLRISQTINEAIASKESRSILIASIGKNQTGEVIAEFVIEWSFKVKGAGS